MRTCLAICLALLPVTTASAQDLIRAITRDGERLGDIGPPITAPFDLTDVDIDPELERIVDQLGSEAYAEREEATAALMEGAFERRQIYALLSGNELSAEQRHRLLSHILAALNNAPRGAVGIAMARGVPAIGEPGHVVINGLIPGFDAAHKLEVRDRITHVDGQPLRNQADFVRFVQNKKPGDSVKLTIQRAARDRNDNVIFNQGAVVLDTLDVEITLGSLQDLEGRPESGDVLRADDHPITNELRWAQQQFGTAQRTIEVNGEIPASSLDQVFRTPIDEHTAIAALMREVERFRQGEMDEDRFHRNQVMWKRALNEVRAAATKEGITEPERLYRQRVADRLAELLEQFYGPEERGVLDE